jgi:peptidoglycan/xylan/chitin deacetylase (PgdA/CDA1 family)
MKIVLCYHSIDDSESVISTSRMDFVRHMEWLAHSRFQIVPLGEILTAPGDDLVALTFDDGYVNFETVALPTLTDLALPSTVFVVSGRAGGGNDWDAGVSQIPSLKLMDWDAISRCMEMGAEIGAHGKNHMHLRGLPDERLEEEIAGCADDIETAIGAVPQSFAYPYGSYDDRVEQLAAKTYKDICTTDLRLLATSDRRQAIPRIDSYYVREPGRIESLGSAAFPLYIRARRGGRAIRNAISSLEQRS